MRAKKIIVLHLAGQYPLAGIAWQAIHCILGLKRLGYEVYYIEDSGSPPYDPRIQCVVGDSAYSVAFIQRMMSYCGLSDHWAYWDSARDCYWGLARPDLWRLYRDADALLNVCGATRLREEHLQCPIRIHVETDPVYEQIKLAQGDTASVGYLRAHTHHFTYGENLGQPDCPIPLGPFDWKPTRPPVIPDLWPSRATPEPDRFTTVTTWQNVSKDISFGSEHYYWSKHLNFLEFQHLPTLTSQPFEIASYVSPETASLLRQRGWLLADAHQMSCDLETYQRYISGSRGEFTVSKDLVVRTRSGWFSDRSACYLAAGKPVITQETGFSKNIPTGNGLFAFSTMEEVLAAIDAINADYASHSRAARELAEDYFAADKILRTLLQDAGL